MQSFAIRAIAASGFRLTLDLSAWGALGVSLAAAVIRFQARGEFALDSDPVALEIATGAANPAVFDPLNGLVVFAAPATATAALAGVYRIAARAEFAGYEAPLFGGTITFIAGVSRGSPSAALPTTDTAWIAAHPFGPAPAPASIATAIATAQAAARNALTRAFIYGG